MDNLPALGTAISNILGPTLQIYSSLLQPQLEAIKSTPCKTFQYGPHQRQKLDIYYPASPENVAKDCPIMIFLYGGGLVHGSKILPMIPNELVYANLAHFFAKNFGFVVIIPDYRLVPEAKFPSGAEDVAAVIDWIHKYPKEVGGFENHSRDLFLMGNSAGGVHISTYILSSQFSTSRAQILPQESNFLRLKAVILIAVPFHFQEATGSRDDILNSYYGDQRLDNCPWGLLKSLIETESMFESLSHVQFLVITATLDPEDEILQPNRDFVDTWNSRRPRSNLKTMLIDGHNHISPVLAVGTSIAREEAWGFEVGDFIESVKTERRP
jgi:hypothetical protein